MILKELLLDLSKSLEGDLYTDSLHKAIYATDASVYRKIPLAIVCPKDTLDLKKLIEFASLHTISLIPRTAGTSLAGQCVGEGIIVDISKYFTKILDVNEKEQTVIVEPGVIRDELNTFLAPFGLFFGPNTSTSNRCMIGGMFGNNSSGTTSIQYGVTRDKVIESTVLLSDGTEVVFKDLDTADFFKKTKGSSLEASIYTELYNLLSIEGVSDEIINNYPKPEIHRRNTGYAIDELIKMQPFDKKGPFFNMNKLLAGSEGTLGITTKIKLKLDKIPPAHTVMITAHFDSISKCCKMVVPIMKHNLSTCEMIDKVILDCTKNNKTQAPNRFFINGDPQAILMIALTDENLVNLEVRKKALIETIENSKLSYAFPSLYTTDIDKVMELRRAGLGLLGNIIGDKKAVACIEDTAVALEDLSAYIDEFSDIMKKYKQEAVYYAHAGAGELHLRPILDLKQQEDVVLFRTITTEVAKLVKKYKGTFSGEHGDGIVRGEFIEMLIGKQNYKILEGIKKAFDPKNIFNRGKIINPLAMDNSLRYETNREEPEIDTLLDFSDSLGILRATEKCNGSGDCRKTEKAKGVMCPSYHATKNEKDTTRGRANALREFLTNNPKENKFNDKALKEVFDLCISCKACASECPSNVDVAMFKAEFLYQYQKENGTSLRDKMFANASILNDCASRMPKLSNFLFRNLITSNFFKYLFGIHSKRSLPKLNKFNFNISSIKNINKQTVVLYIDEFTKYLDGDIGNDTFELLSRLGYKVYIFYAESGRAFLSKGFLKEAKELAEKNIENLNTLIFDHTKVIGIEPSAILSFKDEYFRLSKRKNTIKYILEKCFLIEEFLANEIDSGEIDSSMFTNKHRKIKIHNHCHQKALSNQESTFKILNLPQNYQPTIIPSGCCGMAGSFGYEKEHYDISMQIGELILFPAIRKSDKTTIIAANGTSCRHQIVDGTGRIALHPVSILKDALLV